MTTIQLMHNKKTLDFQVTKMTVYKQAEIIEAKGHPNKLYHLFFYKGHFINAKKTTAIRLQSFLSQALQHGDIFTSNHPITKALLNENTSYPLISNNHMFQKISKNYDKNQTLYILAMFDNYLDERKIQAIAKKTFYSYRRSGQLKAAFRLLKHYVQFRPNDKFAQDMLHHFDFHSFKSEYRNIEQLRSNWSDPFFLESVYFDQDFPNNIVSPILEQYQLENRKFDQLYLLHKKNSLMKDTTTIDELAQDLLTEEDQILLWEELITSNPNTEEILKKLEKLNGYHAIIQYYLHYDVANINYELLETTLQFVTAEELAANYQSLLEGLIGTYQNDTNQLEKAIHLTIKKLLPKVPLSNIINTLENIELPITQKLRKIEKLKDNPDQQFTVGEIYYELEQYDPAIACFEWEMELAPDSSAPIQYLYKCYQAKGDKQQANSYKQLMASIPS